MDDLKLQRVYACSKARDWFREQPNVYHAWRTCPRGDWLLWWLATAGLDRKALVFATCQCARLSLRFVPEGEARPLAAIETAEAWTRGEANIDAVRDAADAADAAAYAAYAAAAAAAAYAGARHTWLARCARVVRRHVSYREALALWDQPGDGDGNTKGGDDE